MFDIPIDASFDMFCNRLILNLTIIQVTNILRQTKFYVIFNLTRFHENMLLICYESRFLLARICLNKIFTSDKISTSYKIICDYLR